MAITKHSQLTLSNRVEELSGVGDLLAKKLHKLGVFTVKDLLELLPRRLEDRSQLTFIRGLPFQRPTVIAGQVESIHSRRSQRGILIIDAKIKDQTGSISALWFSQRYLLGQLKVGTDVMLYGEKRIAPSLGNPFFVKKIIKSLEVAPVYPATAGLNQATVSRLIKSVRGLIKTFPDIVPEQTRHQYGLTSRALAIEACHFATKETDLKPALALLAFEELLVLSTQVLEAKRARLELPGQGIDIKPDKLKAITAALPFQLTSGQRQSAWQIIQDLAQNHPMYRLLYGEVGSGKTAVALMAAVAICQSGRQMVWLNPTAILVAQQAEAIKRIVTPLGLTVAVVTGAKKEAHFEADIIIGTHALLDPKIKFRELGLIIVDEQHRFGVEQRQIILDRHPNTHLLMMSATPIPRSLAQSIFGFLDITYLLDKPPGQQKIETVIFKSEDRDSVETAIEFKIAKGEPGFVICPLINPTSGLTPTLFEGERKAVIAEELRLKKRFPKARIGVVHGKIPATKREELLQQFKAGEIDILLSTTVVEVGIDNPRATWILIEEADRFGLAQLHQLRGRIGRGQQSATCYLAATIETELAKQRLNVLVESTDGLAIAEADLRLRGPGELVGQEQSGLPLLKYANFSDTELIANAFAAAEDILASGLDNHPALAEAVRAKNLELHPKA